MNNQSLREIGLTEGQIRMVQKIHRDEMNKLSEKLTTGNNATVELLRRSVAQVVHRLNCDGLVKLRNYAYGLESAEIKLVCEAGKKKSVEQNTDFSGDINSAEGS
ncbi:MAG TPA: hypothetical protein DG942_06130 [Ruminococcaceae bacterium]|jgi:hypothetical protein|nr:hypothetical protein [Oscillospiraceae bacterium]HCW80668.1 hypothetical protein [Oscillospiraceae bacterium]